MTPRTRPASRLPDRGSRVGIGLSVDRAQRTCAESGLTISDEVSTATNADAGIVLRSSISRSGHAAFCSPWKYHAEPLSASTRPYLFIAATTFWAYGESRDASYDDASRNRAPIGG